MATSPPASSGPAAVGGGPADRPHTISSAYEKGGAHQRPQLTPYTFEQPQPPTIPENGQYGQIGQNGQNLARKPPVPQRCISLDAGNGGSGGRPSLPRNKKPQLTAEQLRPVHHQSVPNFNHNKNDMGERDCDGTLGCYLGNIA